MSNWTTMSNWIFLRGLTRESGHWGDFIDIFLREVPGSSVVSIDLPGNGTEYRRRSPMRVAELARHCQTEWEKRAVAGPIHLLGLSLGAMVAVEWATQRPDLVARCVLINTSFRPINPFWQRLRPSAWRALPGLLLAREARDRESAVLRLTSRLAACDDDARSAVLGRWLALRARHPVSPSNALRQLIAAARYRLPVGRPVGRTLVLVGLGDTLVDPRCSARLAGHWRCDLRAHPSAGHDLTLDDGPWVAATVAQWQKSPHQE